MQRAFSGDDRITRRTFLGRCSRSLAVCTGSALFPLLGPPASAAPAGITKGLIERKLSPYFTSLEGQMVRCELCPHSCEVGPGERGLCGVRENIDGRYYSLVFSNPCAVHIDPVEKKPFYHVLPASRAFSLATAGCNFDCKFCQNWEISQARPDDTFNYSFTPDQVIASALGYNSAVIASTYVEPVIFIEYMLAIGQLAKSQPLLKVMHSNGFINARPLEDLCSVLDAACIDLKGFTQEYYRDMTEGSLKPVLQTLKTLKRRHVHTEIVTLIVPGKNDDPQQIRAMCRWIHNELGQSRRFISCGFIPATNSRAFPPHRYRPWSRPGKSQWMKDFALSTSAMFPITRGDTLTVRTAGRC